MMALNQRVLAPGYQVNLDTSRISDLNYSLPNNTKQL